MGNVVATALGYDEEPEESKQENNEKKMQVNVIYGTQFGSSRKFAKQLVQKGRTELNERANFQLYRMDEVDPEDLVTKSIVICIVSTIHGGQPPKNAKFFCTWLEEAKNDWRVHDTYLAKLRFGVFGCCNSLYEEHFNVVASSLYDNLLACGARPLISVGVGDKNIGRTDSKSKNQQKDFNLWMKQLWTHLEQAIESTDFFPNIGVQSEVEAEMDHGDLLDIENLGSVMSRESRPKEVAQSSDEEELQEREMITPIMREKLTKEGYKLLGTHSAVKLCRWTKAMLRGRGGCYKHTFYGIISYRCMETTPNLACANRCVFCWRHHTNPVGKEWRWVTDKPDYLVEQAIQNHYKMVHTMKDAPGVTPERFAQAHQVKHCALSLVGEPIMYPYIQDFLDNLHGRGISTFLVTNAQFPDKIREVGPVTQFYISIDAATKESLKAVDRPLYQDYWERFLDSMDALKNKQQRTVYRLTLVKNYNMQDCADYAALVARGMPSFIEVKGVTFCGKSDGYLMNMNENVPWHEEVKHFCQKLCSYLSDDYELACEHKHSCCVLIARKDYKINGKWHTWIDYPKWEELINSGEDFTEFDYVAETPSWAVFGAEEAGFNPEHTWLRKVRKLRPRAQECLDKALEGIEQDQANLNEIQATASDVNLNPYLQAKQLILNDTEAQESSAATDGQENISEAMV